MLRSVTMCVFLFMFTPFQGLFCKFGVYKKIVMGILFLHIANIYGTIGLRNTHYL